MVGGVNILSNANEYVTMNIPLNQPARMLPTALAMVSNPEQFLNASSVTVERGLPPDER